MWYIQSGAIKGVSWKPTLDEAFLELFDNHLKRVGHFPDLGILGAGSTQGFDFKPGSTDFFLTEWMLFNAGRIPRMSHEFETAKEHWESLFEGLPDVDALKGLVEHGQDAILDEDKIDAPNSREDVWDDVIDVPEGYEFNAGRDASAEPHELG